MSKTTLTAEVKYKTDEASFRQVMDRGRKMQRDMAKEMTAGAVAASNAAAAQFKGKQWERDMRQHAGPGGLPLPGFMAPPKPPRPGASAANAPFMDPAFVNRSRSSLAEYRRSVEGVGGSSLVAGMGLLEMSRAVEDAQYGFRGLVNNIAPAIMAFGGPMGLAAKATMAAVAVNLLDKSFGLFSKAGDGLAKSWKEMTGEADYEKTIKAGAEAAEQHARKLDSLRTEARHAGDRESRWAGEMAAAEDARRAGEERGLHQRLAVLDAEQQLRRTRAEGLPDAERAVELNRLEKQAIQEKLEVERQLYEMRIGNAQKLHGKDLSRHTQEAGLRKLEEEQRELETRQADTMGEKTKRRKEMLPGLIEAERTRVEARRGNYEGDRQALEAVQHRLKILPQLNAVLDAALANEQAAALREKMERFASDTRSFIEGISRAAGSMAESIDKAVAGSAEAKKAREETLETRDIARLRGRHPARADRMQRKKDRADKQKEYEAQGFTPEQAAEMAEADEQIARGKVGVRTEPGPAPSALDGAPFKPRGHRPETPALDEAKRAPARRRDRGQEGADVAAKKEGPEGKVVNAVKSMEAKLNGTLERLIDAQKLPAEKVKPANQ